MKGRVDSIAILILFCGILIRMGYGLIFSDLLLDGDAGGYVQMALDLFSGKNFIPFWPPGLPVLLLPGIALFGDVIWVHMTSMLFIFCVGAWLLYTGLNKHLKKSHIYLLLCVFAIYPAFIHHAVAPLTHLPVAVCILGAGLTIINNKSAWVTGIWLGIAIMIRPATAILLAVVWMYPFEKRTRWKNLAFTTVPFLIMFICWQIFTLRMSGYWIWMNEANSMNVFLGNNPDTPYYRSWWLGSHQVEGDPAFATYTDLRNEIRDLSGPEQGNAYLGKAIDHILDRPDLFLLRTINRICSFFAFDTLSGAMLIQHHRGAGLIFLILDAICYMGLGTWVLLSFLNQRQSIYSTFRKSGKFLILAYALPYFFTISHPTYHLPIIPLAVWVAALDPPDLKLRPLNISVSARLVIACFIFIQIEWVLMMADRWMSI